MPVHRSLSVGSLSCYAALLLSATALMRAQSSGPPLGYVDVQSATISGALEITGTNAVVRGGGAITARDRTAKLLLNRGGEVNVCSTSSLHVTAGVSVMSVPPLLLALDRGAMEIRMQATARDVVITPDLRFTPSQPGPLNLHIRVTPNGDTCVDNKGLQAPELEIIDQFGEGHYELRAGQHVLFEHGSLREVVDRESSACGCPPVPAVSVAESGTPSTRPAAPGAAVAPPADAAAQHPFPAAQSEGLAPEGNTIGNAAPRPPAGTGQAQVAATMAFGDQGSSDGTGALPAPAAAASASPPTPASTSPPVANVSTTAAITPPANPAAAPATPPAATPVRAQTPPPPAAPGTGDLAHRIGHFFRRFFGGS